MTCNVAFTVAVLSGFAFAERLTIWTWFSLMTAATSRRKPSRSQPSMRIATGYVAAARFSHSTSTVRSGSALPRTFGQSARCTVTPRPRVM